MSDFGEYQRQLLADVGRRLAGRPVRIDFQDPGGGRLGRCYRRGPLAVIELQPGMRESQALHVALHEFAHARFDFDQMWDWQQGEPPATGPARRAAGGYQRRESKAERQAKAWHAWAAERGEGFYGKLFALLAWP